MGEVSSVPAKTMASVIQASIDGVLLQWAFDPNAVDLDACCAEIKQMIAGHISRDEEERAQFGT